MIGSAPRYGFGTPVSSAIVSNLLRMLSLGSKGLNSPSNNLLNVFVDIPLSSNTSYSSSSLKPKVWAAFNICFISLWVSNNCLLAIKNLSITSCGVFLSPLKTPNLPPVKFLLSADWSVWNLYK